eukprot:747079-Hanusia_phi.AAC.2
MQEIQDNKEFSVPATGLPWGDFLYKPPGMNLTQFTFKGIPKSQCGYDHDCREFNNPGQVRGKRCWQREEEEQSRSSREMEGERWRMSAWKEGKGGEGGSNHRLQN